MRVFLVLMLAAAARAQQAAPPSEREKELLDRIAQLERRLAAVERRLGGTAEAAPAPAAPAPTPAPAPAPPALPGGATVNVLLDGYYERNFNRPPDRTTPLRPFDSIDNNFTLSQAAVVIERAPDPAEGRRFGARLDLMFGSSTESLSGSPANEPRTAPYRNIFQAYGTYVLPVGRGLAVDFGRFSSPIGIEGTYVKDQINYSRSLLYTVLPFYHMGFRTSYKLSGSTTATWMLVNGLNQTEDFNGFKSNHFMLSTSPAKNVTWVAGYYFGRESRNPGEDGRTHIADTYVSWNATPKLTIAGEGDYLISRTDRDSAPSRLTGGAGYAKYQLARVFSIAGRYERASDRRLLSGVAQRLQEATFTAAYQPVEGFQVRWEYRRDWSNERFFPSHSAGQFRRDQNTALVALLFWFGGKQGSW